MSKPKPKLLDDALYLTDNGRVVCGEDAGASARYTGRDISGQRVKRVTTKNDAYWMAELGSHISCEQCGKKLPPSERAHDTTGAHTMSRKLPVRTVRVELPTPTLWRWFKLNVASFTSATEDGFVVHDESRWCEALSAAEGQETSFSVRVRQITLTVRDNLVIGAMGSDPQRFIGLAFCDASKLAAGRG